MYGESHKGHRNHLPAIKAFRSAQRREASQNNDCDAFPSNAGNSW